MDILFEVWKQDLARYGIDSLHLLGAGIVAALFAYRNWQKTLLVVWMAVYVWTMVALLSSDLDLQAGMTVVWVCGYGLLGFLFLGYCYYANLK